MNIVVDAHMLGEAEGGNETYVAGLLRGLAPVAPAWGALVTALIGPSGDRHLDPLLPIQRYPVGRRGDAWRVFAEVPRACRRLKADVVHMTYNAAPWLPCPLVLSVHDVLFRRYPEYFTPPVRFLLSTVLPMSMRRASVVLTISEASRRDIAHFYPFTRNKITVVSLAAGPVAEVEPDLQSSFRYGQRRPFVLAVGGIQPRKNLRRLIEAYLLLRRQGATDAGLVLVGRAEWQSKSIQDLAGRSEYAKDVCLTGYVDAATLAGLYRQCAVFAYPSLGEGFGLPVLEAMACGAPVITSNVSSLPEVAGEAALLVDPLSVDQIAGGIDRVLHDPTLREDLRRQGARQAARFSWEKTALGTLAAYRMASAKGNARADM